MRFLLPALLTTLALSSAQAQIFAEFKTKRNKIEDFGSFTVQLDHTYAPLQVANFLNLAEGRVAWPDPANGELQTAPFYDGLEFYSVTNGFEIAGGSPTNTGTGGPGYTIRDDFRNSVPGQLGYIPEQFAIFMDNDGPNTNGSRFFITVSAVVNPALRPGRYTRFGRVVNLPGENGRAVVNAISQSAPGLISIDEITIYYSGNDATNFRTAMQNPNHPYLSTLPATSAPTFTFRREDSSLFLDWDTVSGSIAQLWSSFNLVQWIGPFPVRNVPGSEHFGLDLTPTVELAPTAFFRGVVTSYDEWPSTERPLPRCVIDTNFFDPARGVTFTTRYFFDQTGEAGTYASPFGGGSFEVTIAEIIGPYSSQLVLTPTSGNGAAYRFILHNDLTWTSPIPSIALPAEANPSRLAGNNLSNPGAPLTGGQWTYTPGF